MKLLLLFSLALSTLSTFVTSYELDFGVEHSKLKDVFVKPLYHDFSDSREVTLFTTKFEDGFDKVLENKVEVWTTGKDFSCEYVKVFFWNKKAEAVKLGLRTKKFLDVARVYDRSVFFLKKEDKWTSVEKKEYFKFLETRNFANYAHKEYEKDEKFRNTDPELLVDVASKPMWAEMRETPKKLPKKIEHVVPTPKVVDTPAPATGNDLPGPLEPREDWHVHPDDKKEVVPEAPKEVEVPKEVKKKENLKREKEKDSFLTTSLLVPAVMLAFYVTN